MRAAASTPRRDAPGVTTGQDDQGFHERVQALFLQAVEQQDERRAAWLEQACAGDVRLRDEVASLLRHHRPRQPLVEPAGPRLLVVRDVSTPAWTRPRRMLLAAIAVLALLGVGGAAVQLEVRKALFHSLEDLLVTLRQRQAHSREGVLALRGLRVQERLQRLVTRQRHHRRAGRAFEGSGDRASTQCARASASRASAWRPSAW